MNALKQLLPQLTNVSVRDNKQYIHWFSRIRLYLDGFFDFLYIDGDTFKNDVDKLKLILNTRLVDGITHPIHQRFVRVINRILELCKEDETFAIRLKEWNRATACYIHTPVV